MQKWEYSFLYKLANYHPLGEEGDKAGSTEYTLYLARLTPDGYRYEKKGVYLAKNSKERDKKARDIEPKIIANLGLEGWEVCRNIDLIAGFAAGEDGYLYFKRLIEE